MSSGSALRSLREEVRALQRDLQGLAITAERLAERIEEVAAEESFEVVSAEPKAGEVKTEDTEGRVALARDLGAFLRRCIAGEPRGSSGRDRLRLQNRYYIVVADYEGNILPSPLFLEEFSRVKTLCKRGPSAGRSIFVGVPSKWEAKLVFEAAGLAVPGELRHA